MLDGPCSQRKGLEAAPAASIERQNKRFDIGPGWRTAFVPGHVETAGGWSGITGRLVLKVT